METLRQLCAKHYKNGWPDKDSIHSYIDVYEEVLSPYRHTALNILEIGLMGGESQRMWIDYFDGIVYGIDCDLRPINGAADLTEMVKCFNVVIGDATNPEHIKKHFDGIKFDVVIEDANHDIMQQINIFSALKPYINEGGIYIIEDIQDVDRDRRLFEEIDNAKSVEIIDRRHIKNRYDDCLVIIKNKL